jgi:hypothetical protein
MNYEVIAFTLISLISIVSIGYAFYLSGKNKRLVKNVIELHIERSALEDMISAQALSREEPIDQNDGFIKFLSDSREWAFNYIDTVQNTILVLKEKYDNKKAIDEPLKELFGMLPEKNKEK